MCKRILGLLLLGLLVSSPLLAADLSGNWQLDMANQMGQAESWTLTFKADGDNLTIDAVHPNFKNVSGTGALTGDKITMNFSLPGGIGPVLVDFEGTVKDGKMEGTRKVSYGPPDTDSAAGGGQGGAPGAPPGGDQASNGGTPPSGGGPDGPGGAPPGGAAGGAPGGGAPPQGAQAGDMGGPPGGGAAGGGQGGDIPDTWTAVRK